MLSRTSLIMQLGFLLDPSFSRTMTFGLQASKLSPPIAYV